MIYGQIFVNFSTKLNPESFFKMINNLNNVNIDLKALVHNLNEIKKLVKRGTRIMGIVKSDAYGHGLLPVSQTLETNNIDCLGVASLIEALELRKKGIKVPVIILNGIRTRDEAGAVVQNNLTPVLFDLTSAETLARESAGQGKKTPVHLKLDTGMGRLGIPCADAGDYIRRIIALKSLTIEALISHLSSADEVEEDFTEAQIRRFDRAIAIGRSTGLDLPFNSLANSAGIMAYKKSHYGMVRPGIMLYGGLPSPGFISSARLKPAMSFKGTVLQVRDLPDQTPISYGRTYYTKGPRRIAVLSAGYGDGLPRAVSNMGEVLIGGKKAPIVGRICMNLTICDISGIREVEPGDESVFLGSQRDETITGDDIASWADTISYEIFCSIGRQKMKEYIR